MRVLKWGRLPFLSILANQAAAIHELSLYNLQVDPSATAGGSPDFSWTLSSSRPVIQLSYQIRVFRQQAGSCNVWDSGTIPWRKSRPIAYTGPPLSPDTRYFWAVHIKTDIGPVSASSEFMTTHIITSPLTIQARQSDPLADSFVSAEWIWTPESDSPALAPAEDRAFRKTYTPPSGLSATSADILVAVDDRFSLYVSGKLAGSSPVSSDEFGWRTSQRYHVSLSPGSIVFAIRGSNFNNFHGGGDTPAGLLIAIRITHSDGSTRTLTSDTSWRSTQRIPANFENPSLDDSGWESPILLGLYGTAPWLSQVNIAPAGPTVTPTSTTATPSTPTPPVSPPLLTNTTPDFSPPSTPVSPSPAGSTVTLAQSGTSQENGSSNNVKSNLTGPIVGGVVGGVVILIPVALIILCRKRLFRCARGPSGSFSNHKPEVTERFVEPFTLRAPGLNTGAPAPAMLEPVRKYMNPPGPEYRQDFDLSEGSVSVQSKTVGGTSTRLERLQVLMSELNREIVTNGEGTPYMSELRGRIAELSREDSDDGTRPGHVTIPPPYLTTTVRGPSRWW